MQEVWKDIPGYEGLYRVNNFGEVKSLSRLDRFGRPVKEKFLKPLIKNGGYRYVSLSKKCKPRHFAAHRLVMLAFVGASDLEVNHINGVKSDNRLENLEYCTSSENTRHSYRVGLQKGIRGEKNANSKLTEREALFIKTTTLKSKYLAEIFGMSRSHIEDIVAGRRWKHLGKEL